MPEPQDITRNPDATVVDLRWGEPVGIATEPSSGRKDTGEEPNDVYASAEHNWLTGEPMKWLRGVFSRAMWSSDNLSGTWIVPNGAGVWSTNGVGAFEGFLSDDPLGADTIAADLFLDPNDTGAVRVQASVTKASPFTFPANRDTYVHVPIDTISPPVATEPELAFISVPVGDPAPVPGAGFTSVWRVETDGVGIVDQEILLFDFPVMKSVGFLELGVFDLSCVNLEVSGTSDLMGPVTIDDLLTINGDVATPVGQTWTLNGDVLIGGLGSFTCNSDANFMNDVILGDVPGDTITVNGLLTCTADVVLGDSAFDAVIIAGTTTHTAPVFFSDAIEVNSTCVVRDTLTMEAALLILGASGGSLSTDPTAVCQFNGEVQFNGRARILTGTSVAEGDLSKTGSGDLRYRDATSTKFVHTSAAGHMKGHGQADNVGGPAASIQIDTSSAVAPKATADLDVEASIMVQRAVAGDVIISLEEVGGVGQIGTNFTLRVTATGGTTWQQINFSRTRAAADTTPRVYRFIVDGNGQNVTGRNGRVTATPKS